MDRFHVYSGIDQKSGGAVPSWIILMTIFNGTDEEEAAMDIVT